MFTFSQLIAHLVGDYFLQSDWMALNKTKKSWVALIHVVLYTLPFLFLTRSPFALLGIAVSHFVIDRYRLARYVSYAKNFLAPAEILTFEVGVYCPRCPPVEKEPYTISKSGLAEHTYKFCESCNEPLIETDSMVRNSRYYPWSECSTTGYHSSRPVWLTTWLLIITDNTMHLICNAVFLFFFA